MSRSIRVICPECGDTVEHHCHSDLRRALVRLLTWIPEHGPATDDLAEALIEASKECGWEDEDEKRPARERFDAPLFGSQAWSYKLLGSKDSARSFHGLIAEVCRAAGVDEHAVMSEFWREREAAKKAEEERKAGVQKRKDERSEIARYLKDKKVPLEERIAKLDELLKKQAATHKLKPYAREGGESFVGYLGHWLVTWYGGGIDDQINLARIKKLESETYKAQHGDR